MPRAAGGGARAPFPNCRMPPVKPSSQRSAPAFGSRHVPDPPTAVSAAGGERFSPRDRAYWSWSISPWVTV